MATKLNSISMRQLIMWLVIAVAALLVVLMFGAGFQVAHGNSDIICSRSYQDQGSCAGGSWGAWSSTSQNTDQNSCQTTYQESRTYTGIKNVVTGTFSVRANLHTHCALSDDAFRGAGGTISSQYSACQVQESRSRVVAGTGSGATCSIPTTTSNGGSGAQGTVTSTGRTETTGAADDSKTTTVSATYQQYLNMLDARLATGVITVAPTLVRSGDTVRVTWSAAHVVSCAINGSNGDAWSTLTGEEISRPITSQTTFSLSCPTALGNLITGTAVVNVTPSFQEN